MTTENQLHTDTSTRFLVAAASLIIVIAGLRAAAPLILPFLIAVFLAVISVPFLNWLLVKKVPKPLAVLSTILAAVGVIAVLALVVGRSVNEFTAAAPRYQARLQELFESVIDFANRRGLPTTEWATLDLIPSEVFTYVGGALSAVTSFASNTFLVLLTVIFILFEVTGFNAKLRVAFGKETNFDQLSRMTEQVQHYLVIKTAISAATGLLVGIWVAALGLDFALLWGLVAFLFNFIPNLGSIIAAVPVVLLALVQPGLGPGSAVVIAAGYIVINLIFGTFLEPTLMGRRLGLSTMVVFISLVFWGWVWGPIGMLFSVPLTMVIKIALENTKEFRWVAIMLDANPSETPAPPKSDASRQEN